MKLYAIICYVVAAIAETGGLIFTVLALRENRQALLRWNAANPEHHDGGSWNQIEMINEVMQGLLGTSSWRPRLAVGLIAVGILAGTLGNFTGLPQ